MKELRSGEKRRGRSSPDRPILDGHIRNKKKLIPPMLGFPQTAFVSTIDAILPEIIWIGVLLDWYGIPAGVEVVSATLKKLWTAEKKTNWYRFTEIAAHDADLTRILNKDELSQIAVAFAAMSATYGWPGLGWASSDEDPFQAERRIEAAVRKYSDRFEQPYLTIVSTVIYAMAISEKMKFATGTAPDIEAIVNDWGSERAEMAACSVRACSMAFFPHDGSKDSEAWCKHFWRRNYQISSCE